MLIGLNHKNCINRKCHKGNSGKVIPVRSPSVGNSSIISVRAVSLTESVKTLSFHAKVECSNPSAIDPCFERLRSLKQVKPGCVSSTVKRSATDVKTNGLRTLSRMPRVTVGVTR